jgi:hypothetical protein
MDTRSTEAPLLRPQELDAIEQVEESETRDGAAADAADLALMQRALEQLRVAHLPFRRVAPEEMRALEERRTSVTETVAAEPDLAAYYKEAWNGVRASVVVPEMLLRRAVLAQLELMECAFFTLQLQRYASAPENAGWIELFRRWGMSPHFNRVFDEIDGTLAPDFVAFYLAYLRTSLPSTGSSAARLWDEARVREPLVHHPWLCREDIDRGTGAFMDSGLVADDDVRPGAGGEIDAKGLPRVDQTYEAVSGDTDGAPPAATEGGNE